MTPEERAARVIDALPWRSEHVDSVAVIASAIRGAEAAAVERERLGRIDPKLAQLALEAAVQRARDEAFEEAANIAATYGAFSLAGSIRDAAKRKESS
jgi:hypothetical protein